MLNTTCSQLVKRSSSVKLLAFDLRSHALCQALCKTIHLTLVVLCNGVSPRRLIAGCFAPRSEDFNKSSARCDL